MSYASWVQLGDHGGGSRRKDESEFKCTQLHRMVTLLDFQGTRIISRVPPGLFSSVQMLSHVRLFATPRTAACQASLSITNSWGLLKFMSVESVMPSNHLIFCLPLLLQPSIFPSIRSFQMSQFFESGGQSIGVSASTSVLPMNI